MEHHPDVAEFLGLTGKGAVARANYEDRQRGATFIPEAVLVARLEGQTVQFDASSSCVDSWFWLLPDGSKIYHT